MATILHVRDHCLAPTRQVDAPLAGGRYDRLFPELPSLEVDDGELQRLGVVGGPCDGPAAGVDDDATVAAGWPVLGQFLAHDITADRSPLQHRVEPRALRNFRTPRANLECLYSGGPAGAPYLYQAADPAKLLLGVNDAGEAADVPRNQEGVALLGDPRNDVHVLVSQLHVAMIRLHNLLVDRLREDGIAGAALFEEARRAACWHYQFVLLSDFLPGLAGETVVERVLAQGPRFYRPPGDTFIPFEFADAAYRYGHSQMRPAYRLQARGPELAMFPDLTGFRPIPASRTVDWSLLFDMPGRPPAQRAKRIDGRLARPLIQLPTAISGEADAAYHSLAVRDLQRGQAVGLPSGEAVARHLGVEPLDENEVGLRDQGWRHETPLWYYVLREADVRERGDRLGPVGALIVTEVVVGIVDRDPESYRALDPAWTPTLPSAIRGRFGVSDLLALTMGIRPGETGSG